MTATPDQQIIWNGRLLNPEHRVVEVVALSLLSISSVPPTDSSPPAAARFSPRRR